MSELIERHTETRVTDHDLKPFWGICAKVPECLEKAIGSNHSWVAQQTPCEASDRLYGVEAAGLQGRNVPHIGTELHALPSKFELPRNGVSVGDRAARRRSGLCDVRPVYDASRPRRLESAAHMELAIRTAIYLRLTAEVEVKINGVAEGPSAVACLQARDILSLAKWDIQVIGPEGHR